MPAEMSTIAPSAETPTVEPSTSVETTTSVPTAATAAREGRGRSNRRSCKRYGTDEFQHFHLKSPYLSRDR